MTTQLQLWNLAASHIGNTEQITDLASRQRAAVECAKFETLAFHTFLAEYPWGFANAEATLVDDVPVEAISGFTASEDTDTVLWLAINTTPSGLVSGDVVLLSCTTDHGLTYTDYELKIGTDADGDLVALLPDGTNLFTVAGYFTQFPPAAAGDPVTLNSATIQKKPVGDQWAYQYTLPSDMVSSKYLYSDSYRVRPDAPPIPFELSTDNLGEKVLLTDLDGAILVYTKAPSSYTLLPPHAVLALSYKLAELIAFPVTRDAEIEAKVAKQYQRALHSAIEKEANSQKPDIDPRGESMRYAFDAFNGSDNW